MKYLIVENCTLLLLGIEVNKKIRDGFTPIGGVAINAQEKVFDAEYPSGMYCQAMIRKETS